ncbi:MAG: hypothetical protein INR71_08330 [Terriglobus roseus]|nr:hypothetical protein [Terriglobus roseus]
MASTPPPPKRIRTPPTPLHGPQHDNYVPYSPRRSSRIAANGRLQHHHHADHLTSPNQSWNSTSSSSAALSSARSASHTFSPPQSPVSPVKRSSAAVARKLDALTPRKQRKARVYVDNDSESDSAAAARPPTSARRHRVTQLGAGMLPTPSKTPKKRDGNADVVGPAARLLFPGRPANVDDAMPAARKSRKSNVFSLDGLHDVDVNDENDDASGKIQIYTDSKDRIPDLDDTDDNPFVTKKGAKPVAAQAEANGEKNVTRRRSRRENKGYLEEVEEMEKKVRNNEGMIYVL